MMHGIYNGYYHSGGMTLGWVIGIIFFVLVVWFIAYTIRRQRFDHGTPEGLSALEILNKRYASGELNKEEFIEKKKELKL